MSRYPLLIVTLLLSATLLPAHARIGESRSEMQTRLLRDRRLIEYPERYISRKLSDRAVNYRSHLQYFPEGSDHAMFLKRAEDVTVSRSDLDSAPFPDGWDLHVVYFKNISVFEAYRRNGAQLTVAEVNELLALNRGDSFWKRVNRRDQPQVWQADFILDDGSMVASRSGNIVIFYRPEFEQIVRDQVNAQRSFNESEEEARAPLSIKGF